MTNLQNISIHIQLPDGRQVETAIHIHDSDVVGVSDSIALMVLAQSSSGSEHSAALKAVEILIDDMQTNLSPTSRNTAATCLQESIDKVNEYLYQQHTDDRFAAADLVTSLIAIQYWEDSISWVITRNFDCLLLHAGKLVELNRVKVHSGLLGEDAKFYTHTLEHKVLPGDVLLMAKSDDIEALGQEFVGMAISRFSDNLDVALRQINHKASHNGFTLPPGLILARIDKTHEMRSWVDRLRNRLTYLHAELQPPIRSFRRYQGISDEWSSFGYHRYRSC